MRTRALLVAAILAMGAAPASAQFLSRASARVSLQIGFSNYAKTLNAHLRIDRCHHIQRNIVICRVHVTGRSLREIYRGRVRDAGDYLYVTARPV